MPWIGPRYTLRLQLTGAPRPQRDYLELPIQSFKYTEDDRGDIRVTVELEIGPPGWRETLLAHIRAWLDEIEIENVPPT